MGKTRAQAAASDKRDKATTATATHDKNDKNKNSDKNDKNDKVDASVALAQTLHQNRNREDDEARTTVGDAIIAAVAAADAAINDEVAQGDKLKILRIPGPLRRTVPELELVESVPFIVRGAGARNDTIVATRCRMTYTSFRMAYYSERAFVRDAAHKAKKIVFFRAQGARPLLIFVGFNAHDPKTDIGVSKFTATLSRVVEPVAAEAPSFTIAADGDADRTCHLLYAPTELMTKAKKLIDSFAGTSNPQQVLVKQHRSAAGNGIFTGFLRRANDIIHDNDRSEDDVGDAPPLSTVFNEHGFKDRTSYITGLETATVNLTTLEANQLRHQVLVMPLAALEVHDVRRDQRLMTLRWTEQIIVPTFFETLLTIQREVGCFVFPMTYGNARVLGNKQNTHETLVKVRKLTGGLSYKQFIAMTDVPLPSKSVEATNVWTAAATKTIFKPGQTSVAPKPPKLQLRRHISTNASLSWNSMFQISSKLRFDIVDARQDWTDTAQLFVVEFDDDEALKVVDGKTITFNIGDQLVQLECQPPV